jgi:TatD DNase family protein
VSATDGWVDTHCHLFMVDDVAGHLARAAAARVEWVVVPGVDLESSLQARRIASEHHALWSAGLHPHDASAWREQELRLAALARDADAVGECGLDFYRNLAPRDDQIAAFRAQLALAAELGKPAIIHCRDAFADVHAILEEFELGERAVLHCWTGGPKWTKRFRELGVVFSFAGPITFETGDTVRRGAAEAPPEHTLVETDTPYLTPPPRRRDRNEPANVVKVGEALAGVWGMRADEVASLTTATARRVFGSP